MPKVESGVFQIREVIADHSNIVSTQGEGMRE